MRRVRKLVLEMSSGGQAPPRAAHSLNMKGGSGRNGQRVKVQTSQEHRRETIGSVENCGFG